MREICSAETTQFPRQEAESVGDTPVGWPPYLCEGQLSDGSQGQVGVEQRHAVRHAHGAACRAGGQQQPVDAAPREQTAVEVHLHVGAAGELHLAHDDS